MGPQQERNCESSACRVGLGVGHGLRVANQTLAYFIMLLSSPEHSSFFDLLGLSFVLLSHPTFFFKSTQRPRTAQFALILIFFSYSIL